MTIELTNADHQKLDAFLTGVLEAHKSGEIDTTSAIGALAHVFTAAASDNAREVHGWLYEPATLKDFLSED